MYGPMNQSGKTTAYCNEYFADTEADVALIPIKSCAPGTIVLVIETGSVYMLNSKREWKPV